MSALSLPVFSNRIRSGLNKPRLFALIAQYLIFIWAAVTAFLLRFEFTLPREYVRYLFAGLIVWIVVKPIVFHLNRLDRGWWRFVGVPDVVRIANANLIASVVSLPIIVIFGPAGFPRSVFVLDLILCFLATSGIRVIARMLAESAKRGNLKPQKRTFIYGAGVAGVTLLRESRSHPNFGFTVVGFIDDAAGKCGSFIHGIPVLGPGVEMDRLVAKHQIEQVLIALPSATGAEMRAVLERCHRAEVPCRTVPSILEVIEGRTLAGQIRDVAMEDLLGRNPVHLEESAIRSKIEGQIVAVTGAAGSIGSELCRQIARFRPAAIVAYDCAETSLFYLEREMSDSFGGIRFHPEIGEIRNSKRLAEVFGRYRPSLLYHAAAYKHVPMMEAHVFEAVENNVIGTRNVAAAAAEFGIADFVMISSDKAVRPTSVMGVSKRIAELLIHSLQSDTTKYVAVRFGNVLGSNGSVVPVFKGQIAAGKPITVTHPDMRRYFMTIPEAAQLVLQASIMGKGGEIFVLDMGEPVRIVDLAQNLILLSGLRPGKDVKIEFTGMRPGEKLFEELTHGIEETRPTYHEKIKIFAGNGVDRAHVSQRIHVLESLCTARDLPGLVLELKDLVPDYSPSMQLLQRIVFQDIPRVAVATA